MRLRVFTLLVIDQWFPITPYCVVLPVEYIWVHLLNQTAVEATRVVIGSFDGSSN